MINAICEQIQRKELRILGLSDEPVYSVRLKETFDYTSTFYHKEPLLDIRGPYPHWIEPADLVIASEVFEHVIGPSQAAYDGAYRLLRPHGFLLLTVPYINHENSLEHYPGLVRYKSKKDTLGQWVAELVFEHDHKATDYKPRFHGGPGSTLEIKQFNRERLMRDLHTAGFVDIETFDEDKPVLGINWGKPFRPILAKKPATLTRYVKLYIQHIPQRTLKHSQPIECLKSLYRDHPELFHHRPYYQPKLDK